MTSYPTDGATVALRRSGPAGRTAGLVGNGGQLGDVVAFCIPLLLVVQFSIGGRLFLSEVALALALPFLLDNARRRRVSRVSQVAVGFGLLWLFGLFVTDVYRGTSFVDYSRGWSKVAFLLLNFAALSLLIDGRWRRVTLFAAGVAFGQVLQYYVTPDAYATGDPWKFGFGTAVTLALVLVASLPRVYRRPVLALGILVVLGVVNLKLGFRSLGGVCLLAAFVVLLAVRSAHLVRLDRRALRTITALVASVLAGFVVVDAYGYAAGHGLLGDRVQQKYEAQRSGLGILLSGRSEVTVAARAIRDSPILGHGSWAKDPKYAAALQEELRRAGYRGGTATTSPELIPTHSHLFGSWVEAGIFGAVFWLWALVLLARVLPRLHRLADGRVVLVAFLGVLFGWDVLFSPFGAERRLTVPFFLIVLLLAQKDILATSGERETR